MSFLHIVRLSNIDFSDAVPDSEKSTGQSLADKAGRSKDDAKGEPGMMDKAKDAMGMK
jgi:hypothetical protein